MVQVIPRQIRDAAYGIEIPEGDEVDRAIERVISKAWTRILDRYPNIEERITAGRPSVDTVTGVIEDMVLRVLRNPNGYRQVSIDDYNRTIDAALSAGRLYIADDEASLLAPSRRRKGRIGSVRTGVPRWRLP